ncbi:JAB domain-containing protein [Priestia flexa]|uniref:JAB domain-containing protein n=1 Tax=Priestia flexa TaxID=86664 RepID=UPI00077C21D0|nr:JAB domain-containing protein [Priestia flexa]MED4587671.1 JAB domain-containing protein [Priestia flexa]
MNFDTIFEVVRIKQELKEVDSEYAMFRVVSPYNAHELAHKLIGDEDREVFLVMCLNTKNVVTAVHRCHVGSLNSSLVSPRETFKSAILNNANAIIVAHSHPSGFPNPSKEDYEVTRRLKSCGEILGIELLDHIITTPSGKYKSLREEGTL